MVPKAAVAAAPENLEEIEILEPHPKSTDLLNLKTLGAGPSR